MGSWSTDTSSTTCLCINTCISLQSHVCILIIKLTLHQSVPPVIVWTSKPPKVSVSVICKWPFRHQCFIFSLCMIDTASHLRYVPYFIVSSLSCKVRYSLTPFLGGGKGGGNNFCLWNNGREDNCFPTIMCLFSSLCSKMIYLLTYLYLKLILLNYTVTFW